MLTSFIQSKIGQETVFYDILEKKNNHLYILGNISQDDVFYDILEWKKHFSRP